MNTRLTQVLSDGINTYTYGLGRISQTNTNTEYFIGDALGSVRQMTDPASEITFTQSYDPYGVVTSTTGDSHTEFGFTGESYGDSTQLLYLRARYYNPADGRFINRDTWSGDVNRPLSLNRWGYVEGNPVNYTDSSGFAREICDWRWNKSAVKSRVNVAVKYVHNKNDAVTTYTAAGIAIQCAGLDNPFNYYSGQGLAQVSYAEIEKQWGKPIYERNVIGKIEYDDNGKPKIRTYGLRLNCPGSVVLEDVGDPTDPKWAVEYMRRRLRLVLDECRNCTATDYYIAASLAQNGGGFNKGNMSSIRNLSDVDRDTFQIRKDWFKWFNDGQPKNTTTQLGRFNLVIDELKARGWFVPDINSTTIDLLMK